MKPGPSLTCLAVLALSCSGPPEPPPPPMSGAHVVGVDPEDAELPGCKVTVRALEGADPSWVSDPASPDDIGLFSGDALLVGRTALATRCDLEIPLSEGRYRLTISSGIERDAPVREVVVGARGMVEVMVELRRAVDSTGWACGDLHVHSAPSPDSDVPLDQRLVSAVAEGLDAMVATDHDALADWEPAVEATRGVAGQLLVVRGNEISPGVADEEYKGHFNAIGVPADLRLPEEMPHRGLTVAEVLRAARARAPDALIQINHPRYDAFLGYFSIIDLDPATATGRAGMLATDFDLLEVWNGLALEHDPSGAGDVDAILGDWYALLLSGRGVVATGASDTHRLARNPVGSPRTCVRVADDDPARLTTESFVDGLRGGNAFVTSGPFVDFSVQREGIGAVVAPDADGTVEVAMHVQAADWVPVAAVRVIVNGEEVARELVSELPGNVSVRVPVSSDSFIVGYVEGDAPLGEPAGGRSVPFASFAFTNPVFVDADGDGMLAL